jgi:hypothetical protein
LQILPFLPGEIRHKSAAWEVSFCTASGVVELDSKNFSEKSKKIIDKQE